MTKLSESKIILNRKILLNVLYHSNIPVNHIKKTAVSEHIKR